MSSSQFISEHFELENGVNMTPKCLSFLSALFFYLFNETFQLTFFVAKLLNEWKDKSNKVYILTNVERLRKYAEYANWPVLHMQIGHER